jgi:LmbE family N-acetylglucosaminyl deacetylase
MAVLVIATHPDDEVLGCGGAMARHASQGDQVHVVVVTRGLPELFPPEQIEETRRELQAAHALLGVSGVTFLDFPAPRLDIVPCHQIADALHKIIRKIEPHTIYLPHRGDIHIDHLAVYTATLVAARPVNGISVQKMLSYETLSETEWAPPFGDDAFIPTVFVDIGAYIDKKLQALACYQSQLKDPPNPRSLRSVEALAIFRGGTVSLYAAEAFMLVREIIC